MSANISTTRLTLDTPLTDEQREHLRQVQTSAQSLLELLNDIHEVDETTTELAPAS